MTDRIHVEPIASKIMQELGIHSNLDALANDMGTLIVRSRTSFVRRIVVGHDRIVSVYLKVYFYPDRSKRWRYAFKMGRARREFESLRFMCERGIGAAQPLAWGERRTILGALEVSFLLTAGVEGTVDLSRLAPAMIDAADPESVRERRVLLRAIGTSIGRLHAAGFVDGDMHWRNVLVRRDDRRPEIFFIDSPKGEATVSSNALRRGVVDDLACMGRDAVGTLSRTDLGRFSRAWRDACPTIPCDHDFHAAIASRIEELRRRHGDKERRHAKIDAVTDARRRDEAQRVFRRLLSRREAR